MNESTNTGGLPPLEASRLEGAAPRIRRLKDLPEEERPRERLFARGADALTDAELIGVLFGSGIPGLTAVDLGRDLLADGGGLRAVERSAPADIAARKGIGSARAARLAAGLELGRRAAAGPLERGDRIDGVDAVTRRYGPRLAGLARERFHALDLDGGGRLLRERLVAEGTIGEVLIDPRDVFLPALREGAAGLVVVHNHPSGDPSPSDEDARITDQLVEGGRILRIRLLDHVIVAGDRFFSFAVARGGSLSGDRGGWSRGAAERPPPYRAQPPPGEGVAAGFGLTRPTPACTISPAQGRGIRRERQEVARSGGP